MRLTPTLLLVAASACGGTTVVGDETRLKQVLSNLTSNAIKFTEQGRVLLSLTVVETLDGSAGLRFAVEDTGIGIPEERQAAIFEDYEQEDDTISRRFGGTGLGLSIAQTLVNQYGGLIECESRPGRTVFSILLPINSAAES